jgi:hypothetical protein
VPFSSVLAFKFVDLLGGTVSDGYDFRSSQTFGKDATLVSRTTDFGDFGQQHNTR